ncbi:PHYHIP-C domain-containing protein [Aphelenchoides fujianensis]|nr:PHYHIP-C domain-containing protein [Aphelenchoides fujianensis]
MSGTTHTFNDLLPGEHYVVIVKLIHPDDPGIPIGVVSKSFKTVYSKAELRRLKKMAMKHLSSNDENTRFHFRQFTVLHRCKLPDHFNEIAATTGMLPKVLRARSGHPGSAITSETSLRGVWFSTRTEWRGNLPVKNPFGSRRFKIGAEKLLRPGEYSLFFADFYCITENAHYVSLVLCKKGSSEEKYCEKHLLLLDFADNPFVKVEKNDDGNSVFGSPPGAYMEIFVTEEVAIAEGTFDEVHHEANGPRNSGGAGHRKGCTTCNLPPPRATKRKTI